MQEMFALCCLFRLKEKNIVHISYDNVSKTWCVRPSRQLVMCVSSKWSIKRFAKVEEIEEPNATPPVKSLSWRMKSTLNEVSKSLQISSIYRRVRSSEYHRPQCFLWKPPKFTASGGSVKWHYIETYHDLAVCDSLSSQHFHDLCALRCGIATPTK